MRLPAEVTCQLFLQRVRPHLVRHSPAEGVRSLQTLMPSQGEYTAGGVLKVPFWYTTQQSMVHVPGQAHALTCCTRAELPDRTGREKALTT